MIPECIVNFSATTAIALWGAILSTILAMTKFWQDRFRLRVRGNFTNLPEIGNEVRVQNLSSKPLILEHWEVFYGTGFWLFKKETPIYDKDYNAGDVIIESVSKYSLCFKDERHFYTTHKSLKGRSIYIRLHIAGRRVICRKLYPYRHGED